MAKSIRNPLHLINEVNNDMATALHRQRPTIVAPRPEEAASLPAAIEPPAPVNLTPTIPKRRTPPSRVNLVSVSTWITKESHKALNYLHIEEERHLQDLIQEAIDDLLIKKGALKLMKRPTVE